MEENTFQQIFFNADINDKNDLFEKNKANEHYYLNYHVIAVEGYAYKKFKIDDITQAEFEFNQCSYYYENIIGDTDYTISLKDNFLITPYIEGRKPEKSEIINYLNYLEKFNFFITDPVSENFAFEGDNLMLIDFGSTWNSNIEYIDASIKELIISNFYKGGYKTILLLEPKVVMTYLTKIVAFELSREFSLFAMLDPSKVTNFRKELKKFFIDENCEYSSTFREIWGKLPNIEAEDPFEDMEPFSL